MVSLSAVNASIRKHRIWEVLKNPLKIRLEIVLFWINTFIFFYPNFDIQKHFSNFQEFW